MTPSDFSFIAALVKRHSGIVIGQDKTYLVETRISPLLRQLKLASITAVVEKLRAGDAALQKIVIEAMTTNETLFFRDRTPFESFQKAILPHLFAARPRGSTIRIWCAACSTGQEPYSLAMILDEMGLVARGWKFEIMATDLSEAVLMKAREGLYSQFEVQRGLPVRNLIRYFAQDGQHWRIDAKLREFITFKQLNLMDNFSSLGVFDVIFCRNVLIYFDEPTKRDLFERLGRSMTKDGFLMLGSAESPYGFTTSLTRHPEEQNLVIRTDNPLAVKPPPAMRKAIS